MKKFCFHLFIPDSTEYKQRKLIPAIRKTVKIVPIAGRIDLPRYAATKANINAVGKTKNGFIKKIESEAITPQIIPSL